MITIAWVPRRVTDVVLGLMTRTRVNLRLDDIFVPRPNGRRTEMLAEHKRFLDRSGGRSGITAGLMTAHVQIQKNLPENGRHDIHVARHNLVLANHHALI